MTLVRRDNDFMHTDELRIQVGERGVYSETTYPDQSVHVEKAEIDLFGDPFKNEKVKADLYFIGQLKHINLPMIKYSWLNSK